MRRRRVRPRPSTRGASSPGWGSPRSSARSFSWRWPRCSSERDPVNGSTTPPCRAASFNTLPSGHSTVAASLAAALVLVVPVRLRPLAATLGGLYAGGIAAMTLAAGWHRPSDAVSAFAVVGMWTFGVSALLVALRGTGEPRASEGLPGLVIGAVLVLGLAFGVITLSTTISSADGLHIVRIGLAYVLALGSIVVVAVT